MKTSHFTKSEHNRTVFSKYSVYPRFCKCVIFLVQRISPVINEHTKLLDYQSGTPRKKCDPKVTKNAKLTMTMP